MALKLEQREDQGILILAVVGHLTMGPEDVAFRNVLNSCIAAGKIRIILDCGRLGDMDSVGLGTLVFYHIKLQRAGGGLALLNVSRTHMELLTLLRLDRIFQVFTSEPEAVDGFFPDRAVRHYDILEFVDEEEHRADAGAEVKTPVERTQTAGQKG